MTAKNIITTESNQGFARAAVNDLAQAALKFQGRADMNEAEAELLLCVQNLEASSILLKAAHELQRIFGIEEV